MLLKMYSQYCKGIKVGSLLALTCITLSCYECFEVTAFI